jgi:hypothetical protein
MMQTSTRAGPALTTIDESKDEISELEDESWMRESYRGSQYDYVPSKLYEPTAAYINSKFEKDKGATIAKPKPIDPNHHLLQPTAGLMNASWSREDAPPSPNEISPYRVLSMRTGPKDVESKLLEPTTAVMSGKWKSKEERELLESKAADENQSNNTESKKVAKPSERLLVPTVSNEYSRYTSPRPASDTQIWRPSSPRHSSFRSNLSSENDNTLENTSSTTSRKIKETSPHLLELTSALQHAKWKGSQRYTSPPIKISSIPPSERLTELTAANEHGRYRKPDNDVDPRELAWKTVPAKIPSSKSLQNMDESGSLLLFIHFC